MAQPEPEPPPSSEVSPGPGGLPAIETPEEERKRNRWLLIRETLAFQAKMLLEGTRDLLLVPLTLLAAGRGLARPRRRLLGAGVVGADRLRNLGQVAAAACRNPPQGRCSDSIPTPRKNFLATFLSGRRYQCDGLNRAN